MARERRDKNGKIKPSIKQRIQSWWLGRKIRKGKVPRGRVFKSREVMNAIDATLKGEMTEVWGILSAKLIKKSGEVIDYGVVSVKLITTAFRDYIVDSMQDSTTYPMDAFKYHASGTSTTAESNTDTALGTEVESRATGSQIEGATSNIYKSVGTINYTATYAIVEHGLFSASTGGTLMDRSVFSAINVVNGDSIQFTYEGTFNAE